MRALLVVALRLIEDAQLLIEQALLSDDTPSLRAVHEAVLVVLEALQRALDETPL